MEYKKHSSSLTYDGLFDADMTRCGNETRSLGRSKGNQSHPEIDYVIDDPLGSSAVKRLDSEKNWFTNWSVIVYDMYDETMGCVLNLPVVY